ncbi:hypothetical protein [Planctomycetes bacterium K23_9]
MSFSHCCVAFTAAACLFGTPGCKAAQKDESTDLNSLLQTVSYEPSLPAPSPTVAPAQPNQESTLADAGLDLSKKAVSFQRSVGKGMKSITRLLLRGVFKIAESALGIDDENEDVKIREETERHTERWYDTHRILPHER